MSASQHSAIRWYNSLIVRVVALCVVLVLCLMGLVYFLTVQYHRQVVHLMQDQAGDVARKLQVWVEVLPETDIDFESLPLELKEQQDGGSLRLKLVTDETAPERVDHQLAADGYLWTFYRSFPLGDDQWLQATIVTEVNPQTAIVNTFKNRYLAALSIGFFATLGLMVYLIARTLRPLRKLSDTCAQISQGTLKDVTVRGNTAEVLALEQTFNGMIQSLREKEVVETNLRQAQRLSAIGNLAAGVAHDVRNPLNAIKLLSSHAIDTLEETREPEVPLKQLRTIRNEVDRLEEIVSGFLSLAQEEELHREQLPVDPLIAECVRLVEKDAELREVRFTAELRAGDTALLMDPKQITRAILNVLINAMEACPPGGRVRLFSRVTDRACEWEIRDDGPGLTAEVLESVFDPYFTTKDNGTGLGLSITRGIIEEHGGTISLSSSPGQGCQALITMPFSAEEKAEA